MSYEETKWNPKVFSLKGFLMLAGIVLFGFAAGFVTSLDWVVRIDDPDGVVHMRYSFWAPSLIMVVAFAVSLFSTCFFRRTSAIFFATLVLVFGSFLSFVVASQSATIDAQQYVLRSKFGNERRLNVNGVQQIVFVSEKNYRIRRRNHVDIDEYAEIHFENGNVESFSTQSQLLRAAFEEWLKRIDHDSVSITTRKKGNAI